MIVFIIAWSIFCLWLADHTRGRDGFSIIAFLLWGLGVVAVMIAQDWKDTRERRN